MTPRKTSKMIKKIFDGILDIQLMREWMAESICEEEKKEKHGRSMIAGILFTVVLEKKSEFGTLPPSSIQMVSTSRAPPDLFTKARRRLLGAA